jgi:hypothetical protein
MRIPRRPFLLALSGLVILLTAFTPQPRPGVHPAAPPGKAQANTDCGLNDKVVPDFSLMNVNPTSNTYGQTVTLADLMGEILVVYWAQAT